MDLILRQRLRRAWSFCRKNKKWRLRSGTIVKYYTFIATETGEPHSKWFFAAVIDEASLNSALSKLCDYQVSLDRCHAWLLAVTVIYRKTRDLLTAQTAEPCFRFSPFEPLNTPPEFGTPDYETGGVAIWQLDSKGYFPNQPL